MDDTWSCCTLSEGSKKSHTVESYRPIKCLSMRWKLLLGVIVEEKYDYLEGETLLPEEHEGCRRGSCGTKDQLLTDKTMLKDCKKKHTNLSMGWID